MSAAATKLHHLKIFFSNQYCRAQIVRTTDNHIVADACSWEPALKKALQSTSDKVQHANLWSRMLSTA
jgi:ribosomal protein L18